MKAIFDKIDKFKPFYDVIYKIVLFICKILLIADILITSMSVVGRYVSFIPDPAWTEEIVLTLMAYMAMLSAALSIRSGTHIRMTAFDRYFPKKVIEILDFISSVFVMGLGFVMLIVGMKYAITIGNRGMYISLPKLSRFWMYFPVPIAGFATIIFELEDIYAQIKGFVLKEGK